MAFLLFVYAMICFGMAVAGTLINLWIEYFAEEMEEEDEE